VVTADWIGQYSVASKEESAVEDGASERLYVDGSIARSAAACIQKKPPSPMNEEIKFVF
jgi:hypothetical protein